MATFEERAERLKKELDEATNSDQRRNLSREYELTLRLLRIIRGEVFTLDDINKCRMEIMRLYPGYVVFFPNHASLVLLSIYAIGNPAGCGGNPQILRTKILSAALQISDPH